MCSYARSRAMLSSGAEIGTCIRTTMLECALVQMFSRRLVKSSLPESTAVHQWTPSALPSKHLAIFFLRKSFVFPSEILCFSLGNPLFSPRKSFVFPVGNHLFFIRKSFVFSFGNSHFSLGNPLLSPWSSFLRKSFFFPLEILHFSSRDA